MAPDLRPRARLSSLGHAWRGLRTLLRSEANARIHLAATLAVLIAGAALGLNAGEWALLVFAIALVWVAEALNTAIEHLANALHPERHPLIGQAKDIAAAGVLLAAISAVAIAALVLWQRYA